MKRQAGAQPGTARGAASMKSRGGRRRGRRRGTVAGQPCVSLRMHNAHSTPSDRSACCFLVLYSRHRKRYLLTTDYISTRTA